MPATNMIPTVSLAVLLGSLSAVSQPKTAKCTWSVRDSIRLEGQLAFVEPPMTVESSDQVVMIGWQAVQRSASGKVLLRRPNGFMLAGIRVRDNAEATAIDLPEGVLSLGRPRIAALPDGQVAVVWQGGRTLVDTVVSRLWTSTFANGRWSMPQMLGPWSVRDLGISSASQLTARDRDLALAVPEGVDETHIYLHIAGAWRRQVIPHTQAVYTSLLATRDGYMLATVDGDGISVTRLAADGTSRSSSRVSLAHGARFHYPQLLSTTDSSMVLAWVEGAMTERSVLHVAQSTDGGATWQQGPDRPVDGGLQSFDAIVRGNMLFVAGRGSGAHGPWPFVAALKNGVWQSLPVVQGEGEIGTVSPRFSRRSNVVELYWSADDLARMDREPPALVRVRLSSDCRS